MMSATAFFCASVILSGAIGGMRFVLPGMEMVLDVVVARISPENSCGGWALSLAEGHICAMTGNILDGAIGLSQPGKLEDESAHR